MADTISYTYGHPPKLPEWQPVTAKGAQTIAVHTTSVTPKTVIADDFTSLDNFETLHRAPYVSGGELNGEGVVRHKNQCLTDNMKLTVTAGSVWSGKTRLIICADPLFVRYYALEIETGSLNNYFHFIKGTTWDLLQGGGIFNNGPTKYATAFQDVDSADDISVWYDRPNSTLRSYLNDVQVSSLPVPRNEIPHGDGYRYHGVAIGVDLFAGLTFEGMEPTSYTAEDV